MVCLKFGISFNSQFCIIPKTCFFEISCFAKMKMSEISGNSPEEIFSFFEEWRRYWQVLRNWQKRNNVIEKCYVMGENRLWYLRLVLRNCQKRNYVIENVLRNDKNGLWYLQLELRNCQKRNCVIEKCYAITKMGFGTND